MIRILDKLEYEIVSEIARIRGKNEDAFTNFDYLLDVFKDDYKSNLREMLLVALVTLWDEKFIVAQDPNYEGTLDSIVWEVTRKGMEAMKRTYKQKRLHI